MRPLYVQTDDLATDRITYVRYETEAALAIGDYRLPTSTTDVSKLREAAAIYQKLATTADGAHRDVMARIAFLDNQEEQRRLASAAQNPHAGPAQCMCGNPAAPGIVHRQDGPCYRVDNPPCQTCKGNGCPHCAGHGLAVVNPPQEATQTRDLKLVHDGRAPMPSAASFTPPTRTPAPTPGN
ncbi:hypothetical protein [Nonomuraea cavernae]|uniref:Uncharacterized protein n=1 Tax=Nonomuraea cavernae TaxID=2045107 RepID=A0A917YQI9_9ACTN|nr:hypothetical protein [Nonomuraea cavernae]MCA2184685.1 hypothetical protein [Nonomuraea cavernae]GGO63067.1 hypothetical protein GCM10012289_09120 [Nonomuraea cavernae]